MFLSPDELAELTGKQRPAAQIRALRSMGIRHHIRPDGRPVVLRADLSEDGAARRRRVEPNFAAAG